MTDCLSAPTDYLEHVWPPQVPFYPESSVQVKVDSTAAADWQGDLLAIGLYEEDVPSEGMPLYASAKTPVLLQPRAVY